MISTVWGKRMERVFQTNETRNQASISILISDKVNFKSRLIRKSLHVIRVTVYQEGNTVLNIYASDLGVFAFMKQILLDMITQTNTSPVTVGYDTTLTSRCVMWTKARETRVQ